MKFEQQGTDIGALWIGTTGGSAGETSAILILLVGGILITWLTSIGPQEFPLVGTLKPWQMTFVIVGLPGVLWAALLLVVLTTVFDTLMIAAGVILIDSTRVFPGLWVLLPVAGTFFLLVAGDRASRTFPLAEARDARKCSLPDRQTAYLSSSMLSRSTRSPVVRAGTCRMRS